MTVVLSSLLDIHVRFYNPKYIGASIVAMI